MVVCSAFLLGLSPRLGHIRRARCSEHSGASTPEATAGDDHETGQGARDSHDEARSA